MFWDQCHTQSQSQHARRWKRHTAYGFRRGPFYPTKTNGFYPPSVLPHRAPFYPVRPHYYPRPSFYPAYAKPTYTNPNLCKFKRCCWFDKGSCMVEECSEEIKTTCKDSKRQECTMEPQETCIEATETCETKVEMLEVER